MSIKAKERIDDTIAAEGGPVILKGPGARYHQLISTTGEKTRLRKYYEDKTGQDLPVGGFDPTQGFVQLRTQFRVDF